VTDVDGSIINVSGLHQAFDALLKR